MCKEQNILKGAVILATASIISRIIGAVYKIPLVDILGYEGNGLYAQAYNVYTLLITISSVSLPSVISKLVSEKIAVDDYKGAQRIFRVALVYSSIIGVFLTIGMWLSCVEIATFINDPRIAGPLKALAPTIILVTIMSVIRGYFQGLKKMTPTAVSQITEQVFNAIFSIVLAYIFIKYSLIGGVVGSTIATGIGALFGLIVLIIYYIKEVPHIKKQIERCTVKKRVSSLHILKQILQAAIPVIMSTCVFSLMNVIDSRMINSKLPSAIIYLKEHDMLDRLPIANIQELVQAVPIELTKIIATLQGQLSFNYVALINVPIALVLSISMATIPALAASMALKDYEDVKRKINDVFRISMLLIIPASVGITIFAKPIIELLVPKSPEGWELLAYGGTSMIFIAIAQISAGILQGIGRQHIATVNAIIACVLKVLFNSILLLIPQLNIYGVILSTALCYLTYSVLNLVFLNKYMQIRFDLIKTIFMPLICAILMGGIGYLMFNVLLAVDVLKEIALVLTIGLSVPIYGIIALWTRCIKKEELKMF